MLRIRRSFGQATRGLFALIVTPLVIHERKGTWGRQLRPRVAGWSVRPIETRSAADLIDAALPHPFPLAVFDLREKPAAILADLDAFLERAPRAFSLVLNPGKFPEATEIAWNCGATLVLSGQTHPPKVVDLLARWNMLSRRLAETDGWIPADPAEEDDPYLGFASLTAPLGSSSSHES
jgi:hypothetical protein